MGKIKAVIFDLDGVITDTARLQYLTWKEIGSELGIEIDEKFNEKIKGVSRMDSLNGVLEYGNKENDFTQEEKEKLCERKNEKYQKHIDKIKPEDVFPGIKEFMEEVRAEGIKIAIGSSSSNAPKVIENLELMEYVDYIVDPKKIEKGKPAPDIFLRAAEHFGVKPEECVAIEDSKSGVEAVENAKMFSIAIGHQDNTKGADMHYEDTSGLDLEDILKKAE